MKNNFCSFERPFKIQKNGIFLFEISFFVLEIWEKQIERRVIDGYHEAILARLDHFCGIYGALSAGRLASGSPA